MNTKQILINNGFNNRFIDKEIALMRTSNDSDINVINNITNITSTSHKTDERVSKDIVDRSVSCVNEND